MNKFRNQQNGQYCSANDYEKRAVNTAINEWEESSGEEPKS